ncbi:MAG: dienelactone hydrolase family protein, partial [bacterium]|nr:dienelactone hydrolase family protein [Candidatus Kapabacteria bacterium]
DVEEPRPVVIFVHGFKGFKDWGSNPYVCESLARRGFYSIAFNFSHNGTEGHGQEFSRLDRFERNTFSREVAELLEVIDAVEGLRVPHFERVDAEHVGLIGHSRGGGIAIQGASREPAVRAVAVWGAVSTFDRYTDHQKDRWRTDGYLESKNMRTGQDMRLGIGLLRDVEIHRLELDIETAARRLGRPLLVVHGEQDLSVRIDDGERIVAAADPVLTEFAPIAQTGHTFGAVHPFEGSTPALEEVVDRTAKFLARHLG